jgi:uncharacterized protein YjiK
MNRMLSAVVVLTLIGGSVARADEPPTLTRVGKKATTSIPEASGLAVTKNEYKLWSVSDGKPFKIYKIKHDGSEKVSFTPKKGTGVKEITDPDFEGVTFAPKPGSNDDHYLYLVNEAMTAIVPVNYRTETYEKPAKLENMTGWDTVECKSKKTVKDELKGGGNSGLEGITWDGESFFVMKQQNPGLMIQISANLGTILACKVLTFSDKDYSDVAYDSTRGQFWVLSDKNVYLYDWSSNTSKKEYPLGYADAEGVAYDQEKSRLYIITDSGGKTADLYTYDVAAAPTP